MTCLFCSIGLALAQNKRISGTVVDSNGEPVTGATVVVKGTTVGVSTDGDGKYSISVPQAAKTLVISLIGSKNKEVAVGENLKIVLESDSKSLDEVVVTALGIKRSEKALGYSVGVVKSDDLDKARESNVVNSLSGRVAGVNVIQASGTAGGGSKIILRGQSSLGTAGQPLFVVDGMPISNNTLSFGINGGIDTGSRIGDISSDDIESMSILKGAAASALYGARAKDGAIVITTKKGKLKSRTAISVNSSVRFENPLKLPDFQNEYGPGVGTTGVYSMGAWNGWGPKISSVQDQEFPIFTGDKVTLKANPDNVKDFYNTGHTFTNNISISGGDDKNDFRIGVTAVNETGIIPRNTFDKYNFTFNGGREFSDKVSARVAVSYIRASSEGRPAQGSNDNNVIVPTINAMPRTMDINLLKNNWITSEGKPYSMGTGAVATTNNPYWVLNKNKFTSDLDRIIGNFVITYKPINGLSITNNLGTDFYYDNARRLWAYYTVGVTKGRFITYNLKNSIINNDLIATYEFKPAKDFGIKVIGGHNLVQNTFTQLTVDAQDLLLPNIYSYANAQTKTPTNTYNQRRLVGVYGDVGLSYKDIAYLNITGRNDWSSTMSKSNRSYFYPSVSGSLIFSELISKSDILNFGKLRVSYAVAGSDTDPYQLDYAYSPVNSYFLQYLGSTAGLFPHGGLLAYTAPGVYPDPNLQPQKQNSFEVGTDLKLLNNRVSVELTYYKSVTTNHIALIDAPNSTGYFNFRKNSGKISNEGLEAVLGLTPVKSGNFEWNVNFNFATNKQKVVDLDPSITELNLTSAYNGLQVKASRGKAFGLYGTGWVRDDKGNIVIDPGTGLRRTTSTTINLGKITPDYTLGVVNSFKYKGATLGFVVDVRQGGVMYSGTVSSLRTNGVAKETLLNDRNPIIDQGVVLNSAGESTPNTKEVTAYNYWYQNYKSANAEGNIFDASYVKLRELTFSYSVPQTLLKDFFVKNVILGFEARNLWLIHSNVPHIDPEMGMFATSDIGSNVEMAGIPTARSYGFNLKFNF